MDDLNAAVRLLGPGVRFTNLAVVLVASPVLSFLASLLTVVVAMPRQRLATLHWSERARLIAPVRRALLAMTWVVPLGLGFAAWQLGGPLGTTGPGELALIAAGLSVWPLLVVRGAVEKRVLDPAVVASARSWRGRIYTLYRRLTIIALAIAITFGPASFAPPDLVRLVIGAAVLLFLVLGGAVLLARVTRVAVRPDARTEALVAKAAATLNTTAPRTFLIPLPIAQASLFPLSNVLVLSPLLPERLDDRELEAFLTDAIQRRGKTLVHRARTLVMPLSVIALVLLYRPLVSIGARPVVSVLIWLPLVSVLVAFLLHRSATKAMTPPADPTTFLRATERLVEANVMLVVNAGRAADQFYDRMLAAGMTPDYPRPAPPSRLRGLLASQAGLWAAGLAVLAAVFALSPSGGGDAERLARVYTLAGGGRSLGDLGWIRYQQGRVDEAVVLYRAASVVESETPWHLANLAVVYGNYGRCLEAREAFEQSARRTPRNRREAGMIDEARRAVMECVMGQMPRPRSRMRL